MRDILIVLGDSNVVPDVVVQRMCESLEMSKVSFSELGSDT